MKSFRTTFIFGMILLWTPVLRGSEHDNLVDDSITTIEELETFKNLVGSGAKSDPHTVVQDKRQLLKQNVLESVIGLPDLNFRDLPVTEDPFGNPDSLVPASLRNSGQRQKRSMDISNLWPKGIVPYVYTDEVDELGKNEIQRAMHTYERFSCIRFVPWHKSINEELQLGNKTSYLKFIKSNKCWAVIGNRHSIVGGQRISCCTGTTCIHEIGHSLGFWHEQNNNLDERNWWIRVNEQNIKKGMQSGYAQRDFLFSLGYDISSYMHYKSTETLFGNGKGPTFTVLFPGIRERTGDFYMMHEIAVSYECKQLHCSNFTLECVNDGFVTLVDNKCACMCVPGLDPETGCATPYKSEPAGIDFPGGQWAMPMPASGCPDGTFSMGSLTHFVNDGDFVNSRYYMMEFETMPNKPNIHFCVSTATNTEVQWPVGNYCIFRKGESCPEDFKEGYFQYSNVDQHGKAVSNYTGTLPDGVYKDNIRLQFCCRDLGIETDEMVLPSKKPLILFASRADCQPIRGMHVYNMQYFLGNLNDQFHFKLEGRTPIFKRRYGQHTFSTNFCYYKPSVTDCGAVIELIPENPTASFTSPSGKELDCTWLIKAPKGDNILLNFPEFNMTGTSPGCRDDNLEIRYAKLGQKGIKICGQGRHQSTRSIMNYMYLRLNTYNSEAWFRAEVQLIQAREQCFLPSDRGATYAGTVNYAENFQMCVPWKDVGHCLHSAYNIRDNNTLLESNYCRLPNFDDGIRPWCYTTAKDCTRTYCDPCLIGNRYDVATNCEDKKKKGYCRRGREAFENCAKTCSEHFPPPSTPAPANTITCPAPGSVVDGDPVGSLTSSYKAGEGVVYKCRTSNATKERYCLTSGKWSAMGFVCSPCSDGWTLDEVGWCYKYYSLDATYNKAEAICQQESSTLPITQSDVKNKFVARVSKGSSTWIGLSDRTGQWKWADGRIFDFRFDWSNWRKGEPSHRPHEDCVITDSNGKWSDMHCSQKRPFLCTKPLSRQTICADFWDECPNIFSDHPEVFASNQAFVNLQCPFTGGICGQKMTSCSVDGGGDHVITSNNNRRVFRGEIVQYSCARGYVSKSGNKVRGCQASGKLTGKTYNCTKGCPGEWKYLESYDACYRFFNNRTKYGDAEKLCKFFNATVTTAKDVVENKFVDSLSSSSIWLGLTDREKEGTFIWSDGEKLTGWSNWDRDEPNNRGSIENCAIMSRRWRDYSCTTFYPVVCKVPRPDLVEH